MYLGAKRRYINTLPFLFLSFTALAAIVLIMTAFSLQRHSLLSTELATPSVTDVRTVRTPYRV